MYFIKLRWRAMAAMTAFACMGVAQGAPSLTTIQDILYKADGTRFNGTISVSWTNFTVGQTTIPVQSITAQVSNGVLNVQLTPTTNASAGANYQVRYSSQGRYQFTEVWAVPPSTAALKIRDVRVSTGAVVGPPPVLTAIEIGDVSGLLAELANRPLRGAAYGPSRAAVINATGQLDGAAGNLNDCVRVDGTAGPCGGVTGASPVTVAFADGETPAGPVDGSNAVFAIARIPQPAASLAFYRNGMLMKPAVDFTLAGASATFLPGSVPQAGDLLTASYRYAGSDATQPVVTANFVDAETPAGAVNGSNAVFTVAQEPTPAASVQLYRNGILMKQGVDYAVNTRTVTFTAGSIPQGGDLLQASYRYGAAGAGTAGGISGSYFSGPQVLCSAAGFTLRAPGTESLGSCRIAAGNLRPGDRVEVRFEYAHSGAGAGFTVDVRWNGNILIARTALFEESAIAGRVDAGVYAGGAQWSSQTWGASAPLQTGLGTVADALDAAITIGFGGTLVAAGDELSLRNFTVLRYPAQLP